ERASQTCGPWSPRNEGKHNHTCRLRGGSAAAAAPVPGAATLQPAASYLQGAGGYSSLRPDGFGGVDGGGAPAEMSGFALSGRQPLVLVPEHAGAAATERRDVLRRLEDQGRAEDTCSSATRRCS
ncbi:hypothetical protein CFC21_112800, partial [Triticum aestivum]|nr:hypothetical protein [Triticum aestivum]